MNCRTPRNKTPARCAEITGDLRMKLTAQQVAGNTWCIVQPRAMVPYYQLNEREIILLDSGCMLHGELEEWLEGQGLRVRAILNTHDHWDHVAANAALQQRQGSRIYLPRLEAAAHASPLAFKAGHENGNYREVEAFWRASSFPTSSMTIRQRRKKLLFPARRLQIPHFLR